jgi:hypothetical protein
VETALRNGFVARKGPALHATRAGVAFVQGVVD